MLTILLGLGVSGTLMYLYWEEKMVTLAILLYFGIGIYLFFLVIFFYLGVLKRKIFSGRTYLNKTLKKKLKALKKKIIIWNVGLFLNFGGGAALLSLNITDTTDLQPYISGEVPKSSSI